jgi:hypothetical protein
MEERKRGLGYHGCAECNVKVPEKECVSCCVPRRESMPLTVLSAEKTGEPLVIGWGSAD